ncbi:hypothetical protein VTK56DRAFT_9742 [Thermocarpiscus australiensis]
MRAIQLSGTLQDVIIELLERLSSTASWVLPPGQQPSLGFEEQQASSDSPMQLSPILLLGFVFLANRSAFVAHHVGNRAGEASVLNSRHLSQSRRAIL